MINLFTNSVLYGTFWRITNNRLYNIGITADSGVNNTLVSCDCDAIYPINV